MPMVTYNTTVTVGPWHVYDEVPEELLPLAKKLKLVNQGMGMFADPTGWYYENLIIEALRNLYGDTDPEEIPDLKEARAAVLALAEVLRSNQNKQGEPPNPDPIGDLQVGLFR